MCWGKDLGELPCAVETMICAVYLNLANLQQEGPMSAYMAVTITDCIIEASIKHLAD
jgi:hypothetical protein